MEADYTVPAGLSEDEAKAYLCGLIEHTLWQAALRDPIDNYVREQDHFTKYAPRFEVDNWVEWNKSWKKALKNRFASNKQKDLRIRGEQPAYIEKMLEAKDPLFWKNKKKVNAFYRRNPLFCIPEVI